jgi:hypothetical protein
LLAVVAGCAGIGYIMACCLQTHLGGIKTGKAGIDQTHNIILIFKANLKPAALYYVRQKQEEI